MAACDGEGDVPVAGGGESGMSKLGMEGRVKSWSRERVVEYGDEGAVVFVSSAVRGRSWSCGCCCGGGAVAIGGSDGPSGAAEG